MGRGQTPRAVAICGLVAMFTLQCGETEGGETLEGPDHGPDVDASTDLATDEADADSNPYCPGVVCSTRPLPLYADADGDGVGAGDSTCNGCTGATELPPGYSYSAADCDDSNPEVQRWAYPDQDGDGRAASDETQAICAAEDPPDGYVRWRDDCDDSDPMIHLGAVERFFDGVDSNCDGNDDPVSCSPERECGCDALDRSLETVDTTPGCEDELDLFVEWTEICFCDGCVFAIVGNSGGVAMSSSISVQIRSEREGEDDLLVEFTELLGPGELGVPIPMPIGGDQNALAVELSGGTDCSPTNNRQAVELPSSWDCLE
jgi:hypothetical protein